MLVPLSWLRDFIDIDEDLKVMAERFTMTGSNVEGITPLGEDLKNIVIGQILKVEKHPNADKLVVTQVDLGGEQVQIVTGATNVKEGDKIPVAVHGATLEGGLKIKKSKLRGVVSQGMLCSAEELGIDPHGLPEEVQEGILILPEDAPVGKDFLEYLPLKDIVIDFEITPNRPDCLSILGMAREGAATFNLELKRPEPSLKEEGKGEASDFAKVAIEAEDLCPRYIARVVEDIVIEPSPLWMQRRLQAAGVRSINNIVDITNYVMLELGQPLHAFDLDKLSGHSIVVRRAKEGEVITTLDDVKRTLDPNMLVIADDERAVAIAGVMGGANSEITPSTKRMLLESANFFGPAVRRASRKVGLRSEASMRFEKGIDPELCELAADRACELIEALGAGKVVKGSIDVYPGKRDQREVLLRPEKINALLGVHIDTGEIIEMLERLEIGVEDRGGKYYARIPSFRDDIVSEADLAEEVGRLYGYDKLPSTLPESDATLGKLSRPQKIEDCVKELLASQGYSEVYTYSFVSPKVFDQIKAPEDSPLREAIALLNPLGEDHSIMRTTLLPNMLEVVKHNLNQKAEIVKIFEVGAIYVSEELPLKELPEEPKHLALALCGKDLDLYDLKRSLETLIYKLKLKDVAFFQDQHFAMHPGRCGRIMLGEEVLGFVGEVHPDVLENYDISERVYIAELDLDLILASSFATQEIKPLPKFPASRRDLALVVGERVAAGEILTNIEDVGGELVEKVELFDVYRGGQIPEGFKSVAFAIIYRSDTSTLTDEQVNELHQKIVDVITEKYDATLRE